jgi:hypothetical protein
LVIGELQGMFLFASLESKIARIFLLFTVQLPFVFIICTINFLLSSGLFLLKIGCTTT